MYTLFARKLFGVKMERVTKTLLVWMIVFWGLHLAEYRLQIAPFVLYLTVSSVSAGVMWQALSSDDNAENMKNLLMMPFSEKRFIFSYVSVLGVYTILTKTMGFMAVAMAVCGWKYTELLGSILCMVNAILMTACVYAAGRQRGRCKVGVVIWAVAVIVGGFLLWNRAVWLPVLAGNAVLAGLLPAHADAYAFYDSGSRERRMKRSGRHFLVWRYLFRYLAAHRNYLMNTAVMWLVACVLPIFLGQIKGVFVMPIGFAILSLNTPICTLLSCDRDLEQAVRFLPGQKKAFCVPYCLFMFLCNMTADLIFLGSWYVVNGGFTGEYGTKGVESLGVYVILSVIFFALQSAVGSVLLEWFYPVRGWRIESDLWHHPRKYLVPAAMLLLAGVVGTIPALAPVLVMFLAVEVIVILIQCRRN